MARSLRFHLPAAATAPLDGPITLMGHRLRWAFGALRLTLSEPADGLDRVMMRIRQLLGDSASAPGATYRADDEWHEHLHQQLDAPWPCCAGPHFDRAWSQMIQDADAAGIALGRGTYGGWDDGDPALARALWCLMAHLSPEKVVETGVARGITSRMILEFLDHAGGPGRLWSIDLPAMDSTLHDQIGILVPERLRSRWTYLAGTSRRRLPSLLQELGSIDLFVHDSSHTARNVRYELGLAWPAVGRGALVVDDVQQSEAFTEFACAEPEATALVAPADDRRALFGIALRRGD